ncbi:MAG: hypothetical protein R6V45_01380, partial [Oceanipulchritudo sp.]
HWTEASMERTYRGSTYRISIRKPEGICKGKVTVKLDGSCLPGTLIPASGLSGIHDVEVLVEAVDS